MAKIKFKNGGSFHLPDGDSPDAGRGLSPFVPHPCQEDEIIISNLIRKGRNSRGIFYAHAIMDEALSIRTENHPGSSANYWRDQAKKREDIVGFVTKEDLSITIFFKDK